MKKLMSVDIKGKSGPQIGFDFYGDPELLDWWRSEGIDVGLIDNKIPWWAARWPRTWVFFQDILNFKNPFSS